MNAKKGKYGLTRKQKAFADHILNNPKESATKAAQATYQTNSYDTARALASQNLAHPSIQLYLDEHIQMAKDKIVYLSQSADKEDVQFKASESILDRALGKAVQRSQNQHQHLIRISLSDN